MSEDRTTPPGSASGSGSASEKTSPRGTGAGSASSAQPTPTGAPEAPYDKKRVALLNGACGQVDRLRICGQVVDVPITRTQKSEGWHALHNLPQSLVSSIRPMQDFTMLSVRRPRLQIEILGIAPEAFDESRSESVPVLYTSPEFTAADDSFFSIGIDAPLAPGQYVARVILRGVDSIRQSVADLAYIGASDSLILKKDIAIGHGRIRILPADFTGRILTSDIDQTFLDTPIHSTQGLMDTLFETPGEKNPIAGLPTLYRKLQSAMPLLFISASPHFFRRTLSAVFESHSIELSALHLKYLAGTIDSIVKKFTETMLNLNDFLGQGFQNAAERSLKFLGSSFTSLFDHVSYKLITLLENRLMQPTGAREILMGDNKESDFFIFTLYQYLLLGAIADEQIENYLYRLNFQNRESLTRDAAKKIHRLTRDNLLRHGAVNPVEHVWMNLSRDEPGEASMRTLIAEALPPTLGSTYAEDARLIKPRACRAGVGFALAACDAGLLDADQTAQVLGGALGGVYQERVLDRALITQYAKEFQFTKYTGTSDDIVARMPAG